jgi:hypothetical protein
MSSFNFDADASSIAAALESLQDPIIPVTAVRSGSRGMVRLVDTGFVGDVLEHGLSSGRSGTSGDFEMIEAGSVAMSSRSIGSPVQKYKVMRLPRDELSLETLCCGMVGQGPTFCIRKYCQMVHQGGRQK